ncbi:MAG TPA: chloride channel protein [Dermatophilaceae bacterium]
MSEASGARAAGEPGKAAGPPADLTGVLRSRGYHALLLAAAVIGLPIAIIAFGFLAAVTKLEKWVWQTLPQHFGWDQPRAWYAVLVLVVAGVLVGLVVARFPGQGGHVPVRGLGAGMPRPVDLTGVVLAATFTLVLGAVLGPEAPLTALGGGLGLLAAGRTRLRESPQGMNLIAAAASAAAIATIFGNPLVAAVLMLEIVGLAGSQVLLVLLPALVSSGIGALIFTGLGAWTGISVPSLQIPGLPAATIDWVDPLWVIPIAVLAALGAQLCRRLGLRVAQAVAGRTLVAITGAGLFVGTCAAAYTLITGRSALDVLQSGESALPALVSAPASWPIATLVLLLILKGAAYGVCLGSFRGGPTFPAVYLGAAIGVLMGPLPGLGVTAAVAIGMTAATTAVLRLPVTSIILVVLLLGPEGTSQLPIILLAAAVAMVTAVILDGLGAGTAGRTWPWHGSGSHDS